MPDASATPYDSPQPGESQHPAGLSRHSSTTSLRDVWQTLVRRKRLFLSVLGGLLLSCVLYCLIAPSQFEASARVALRTSPAAPLNMDTAEPMAAASILSTPLQLETLANVFRSEQLAWRVITEIKLYEAPAFNGRFAVLFPGFLPDAPWPAAQEYLLDRFKKHLRVETLPRTLLIEIRFRSKDAALSAAVVNALVRAYGQQESDARVQATAEATEWLQGQLKNLKARVAQDSERLAAYQRAHGILSTPETLPNGSQVENQHSSTLLGVDELGRQLVAATTERILRESEYRAASEGNPELVFAADPRLQAESGRFATALLEQIHGRQSELEVEQAQLSSEHGPNFPRVVEIHHQLEDLEKQKQAEDAKLVERFRSALQAAQDREQMVRKSLQELTGEGLKQNQAATEYAVMRQEANSSHEVYMRVMEKVEQAGMIAGVRSSAISVVDYARQPVRPVAPNLPVYLGITFFGGVWLALGAALLAESADRTARRAVAVLLGAVLASAAYSQQPPTPNPTGSPLGTVPSPAAPSQRPAPNPKEAPAVWDNAGVQSQAGSPLPPVGFSSPPMAAPIGPGDSLDISEFHTPEFHSLVRVSAASTVTLPMIGDVPLGGMDEQTAAHAIEAALVAKGMLLHPQVSVLVTGYAGQDVSVLGEVARPGVYPYTLHHRLLDLISASSGLAPSAGRLVNVFHRSNPEVPIPVVLDPSGIDTASDHNPELLPGDTVQVSRAGLVYVIGDVVRPGGFPVDPAQGLTVVQALSLAWGPTQTAGASKALLIREQKGGRTLTTLNLRRMIHGQDPDQPVRDRDILFVPDSTAKSLWNKAMEATIQSAIGLTIYAGLVYSQRF